MDRLCETQHCHDIGKRVYISRTGHKGFMTIRCEEHLAMVIEQAWLRFRRGVWW